MQTPYALNRPDAHLAHLGSYILVGTLLLGRLKGVCAGALACRTSNSCLRASKTKCCTSIAKLYVPVGWQTHMQGNFLPFEDSCHVKCVCSPCTQQQHSALCVIKVQGRHIEVTIR